VLVSLTAERHGVDGVILATSMAGVFLIAAGLLRLGTCIKFIPYPVRVPSHEHSTIRSRRFYLHNAAPTAAQPPATIADRPMVLGGIEADEGFVVTIAATTRHLIYHACKLMLEADIHMV
jgi:hypothetical protein